MIMCESEWRLSFSILLIFTQGMFKFTLTFGNKKHKTYVCVRVCVCVFMETGNNGGRSDSTLNPAILTHRTHTFA